MPSVTRIRIQRKPVDPTRINIQERRELTYWARHFGINEAQLETLVQTVGPLVADVQEEIERTP
jgi:hypothetical protein